MPRYPNLSGPAEALPPSTLARIYECAAACECELVPFHVGNSHLAPPAAARLGSLGYSCEPDAEIYGYCSAKGDLSLVDAIVDKVRRVNRMEFAFHDNVQITSGATHALSCAMRVVLNPGDEMLLLSPHWPMSRGIALSAGIRPVEVPFFRRLLTLEEQAEAGLIDEAERDARVEAMIEEYVTPDTAALYFSNPNNPSGKVLTDGELRAIARVATRHDLWVISDEVYEDFTYEGRRHVSLARLPGMAERTLTAFSFSKSYVQAGLRVGYLVGPAPVIAAVRKMANHTIYSVPRAMQRAAFAALTHGDEFLAEARRLYRKARDLALAKIVVPTDRPQGSTYLFLNLQDWAERGADSAMLVLERLARAGVLLVPGQAFGSDCRMWARLCFTAVPLAELEAGIERLNAVLEAQ